MTLTLGGNREKKGLRIAVGLFLIVSSFFFNNMNVDAAQMSDYCAAPPYLGSAIEPNLLLMIDNSASMFDLTYTDTSHTYCANAPTTSCTTDSYCAGLGSSYCYQSTQAASCKNNNDCNSITPGDTCVGGTCQLSTAPVACSSDSTCSAITSGDYCNNRCAVTHMCFDNTYNDSNSYTGLFNQAVTYCYSGTTNPLSHNGCIYSGSWNEFDGEASAGAVTMPTAIDSYSYGGASSQTPFVYVHVDSTTGQVDQFIATGNFLNWLTMSKFDIEKKVLTGGRYDSSTSDMEAQTRGCSGRKFIKTVPNLTGLTFAIRGGSPAGIQNMFSQATQFGQTYIEIYQGTYNAAACTAAMNDWMNVTSTNLGPLQVDTKNCIGGSAKAPALITANQAIHDCFWYFNGHGLSNMTPIQNACANDWASLLAPNTNNPASITDPNAPDAICSSVLDHAPSLVWPDNGCIGGSSNACSTTGYLGRCYNFSNGKWDASAGVDSNCSLYMNEDFCQSLGNASQVTDPAENTVVAPTVQNVPGFVSDLGVAGLQMINDYSSSGGQKGFKVEIYDPWHTSPWPPTGIIDQYKGAIRFGFIDFQDNGSGSECNTNGYCSNSAKTTCTTNSQCPAGGQCVYYIPCVSVCSNDPNTQCYQNSDCTTATSTGTCQPLTKTDGGLIGGVPFDSSKKMGYIGPGYCSVTTSQACTYDGDCPVSETCSAGVGNHTTGMIQGIDGIAATSWTPLAETFYNAMGYFARNVDYPVPPTTDSSANPPTSRNFNFSNFPTSYNTLMNPSVRPCQKNNIIILTDGASTADLNPAVNGPSGLATTYESLVTSVVGSTSYTSYDMECPYAGSQSLPVLTWIANNRNIKNLSRTNAAIKHCTDNLFGPACGSDSDCGPGNQCTNVPTRSSESISTWVVYTGNQKSTLSGLCDPLTQMTAAATNGGTQLFQVSNMQQLQSTLQNAFDQVAAKAASGTAASVLATGQGSGANIIQAVYYPHKKFPNAVTGLNDEISWIGRLTNLWYYIDPFSNYSTIREDDGTTGSSNPTPWAGDKILHTKTDTTHHDFITQMTYSNGATVAYRWADPAGNGVIGTQMPTISFEDLGYLWEAGTQLWMRNLSTSPRTIKTSTGSGLINFTTANASTLAPYLQAASSTEASNIISWVTGSDVAGYRSRTVTISTIDNTPRVWKLGDVINSTPMISSWKELNGYYGRYGDSTYGIAGNLSDAANPNQFTTTAAYKARGMVFAGANDGMLHAFKLGTLQLNWTGQDPNYDKARMIDPATGNVCSTNPTNPTCGQEVWAFIPKNALPYLKYIADPAYCHVFTVDLTPVIFDASINGNPDDPKVQTSLQSSWKTILIGGMKFGGACSSPTTTCTNCVKTPTTDPANSSQGLGFSSYFAIDITDSNPNNWNLLWEFNDPDLGFATTGPAIVRIDGQTAGAPDKTKNGNWFVVLGSGPTGPINNLQFIGNASQNLKLFILDLRTGTLLRKLDTGMANAFAGNLIGSALDLDNDYQDELVYVPYVSQALDGSWTNGGVGRLLTKKSPDPAAWVWNRLIDNVGPVTAAVGKIDDATVGNLWVYFGTGRYYYVGSTATDDPNGQRYLFGIKDPCQNPIMNNVACTAPDPALSFSDLTDVTNVSNVPLPSNADAPSFKGWYIALDPSGQYTYPPDLATNFLAERSLNDPSVSTSSQVVYFTSYKPYTDACLLGGKSFLWCTAYNTGGPCTGLTGMALVQSSTGAIQQISLSNAFTDAGGRKTTTAIEGPISGAPITQSAAKPVKQIIHIRER